MNWARQWDGPAPRELISQFLTAAGDGSGAVNLNGNYSAVPVAFFILPPAGRVYHIHRMIVNIRDTLGFQTEKYGNIAALANGIVVQKRDASALITDLTAGDPVKNNGDWTKFTYSGSLKNWGPAGQDVLASRWTFSESGHPVRLVGAAGERLTVTLNDNLTGLIGHHFIVQGHTDRPA